MATNLVEIPRGPLYSEEDKSYDSPDEYEKRLRKWRDSALEQGLADLRESPEYDSIDDYINLIQGDFYANQGSMPSWRTKFSDNRISKARIETLAYLTDIKPTIDVSTKVEDYRKAADIIRGIIQHEWAERRMDVALEEVIDHALFGTGYWKIGCSYPGEFTVVACGMDMVIPVQQGKDLQDSTAVLYRAFKPPHFFQNRWPSRCEGIEREADPGMLNIQSNTYTRPWNINEYTWNLMSPAMRWHKARMSPQASNQDQWADFPLIQLQEFWIEDWHINESSEEVIVKDPYRDLDAHNYWYRVKPGGRLYPRKRLLVFGGDRVMYDGPSPYWHGLFPFAKLRLNPVVWSSNGLSYYRDLKPINESINRIGAGFENIIDKAIKPQLITKDGSVNSTSWEKFFSDKPGGKLKLTPIAQISDVRFIEPPVLPSYTANHQQYLLQTFRELSGSLDLSSMQKKKQLPGGDTVEQFKDAMAAPRRRELRQLEVFLEDAGRIAVPSVAQFFSRDQRMRILGPEGVTDQDFDPQPGTMYSWAGEPEEFARNFGINIVPGSLHTGSKDREKQFAMVLHRQGAIGIKELLRRLDIGNIDKIMKELQEEHQAGFGGQQKPGGRTAMTRGQKNGGV